MMRRWTYSIILAAMLIPILLFAEGAPFKASSIDGITEPYLFAMSRWETSHLISLAKDKVRDVFGLSSHKDGDLVKQYFNLAVDVGYQEFQLEQAKANNEDASHIKQLETDLAPKQKQLNEWKPDVQATIEKQVAKELRNEGLAKGRLLFPPVAFDLDNLPTILVVSPRQKIELLRTVTLDPNLSVPDMESIEQRVEQQTGLSAEVEGLGGLSTYPSLIPRISSLTDALSTVPHEWTHQYLAFHPLGRNYGANNDMTTINETVADMVGQEVGARLMKLYGLTPPQPGPPPNPPAFDFNKEMRRIRVTVDQYLADGQVTKAESFMKESQQFLAQNGYYIRVLNQAYFAFHGSYADTAASTSPIGGDLQEIRAASPTLGAFLKKVAEISSYQDLQKLVSKH